MLRGLVASAFTQLELMESVVIPCLSPCLHCRWSPGALVCHMPGPLETTRVILPAVWQTCHQVRSLHACEAAQVGDRCTAAASWKAHVDGGQRLTRQYGGDVCCVKAVCGSPFISPPVPAGSPYLRARDSYPLGRVRTPLARPDLLEFLQLDGLLFDLKVGNTGTKRSGDDVFRTQCVAHLCAAVRCLTSTTPKRQAAHANAIEL